jgi:16S rRNA G527 N7-methylase RsmG
MFSSGQINSKQWAVNTLKTLNLLTNQNIIVVGSWFGTLGLMIKSEFPYTSVKLLDIDPRCEIFLKNIVYDLKEISPVTGDMYEYTYNEHLVVNTACEHIADVKEWLNNIPKGTHVLLQSNNFFESPGHINCVNHIDEFKEQTSLSTVLFADGYETPMYTRYMIIGQI